VAKWLRMPLIVAALLAIPTIIVQESDLRGFWEILAAVLDWCIWAIRRAANRHPGPTLPVRR